MEDNTSVPGAANGADSAVTVAPLARPYDRTRAILTSPLPPTPRAVMVALVDHLAAPGGWCWPSVDRLALLCGRSARTVRRALGALRSAGVLEVEEVRGRSSRYRVCWAALATASLCDLTHPGHGVTPDTVTGAPDTVTGGADSMTGAPDTVTPEVGKEVDQEAAQEVVIHHTSDVSPSAPATPSSEAPAAQPACTHGTPLKSILSSDLTGILTAAGLTAIEDLRGHSRDSIAYLCAPRMSRGKLTALDQALRRWSRTRGEEWGLSAEGGGAAPVQESAELLQERARQQAAAEQPRQARASWTPPEPVWLRDHARWRQEAYGTRPATPQPIGPTPFDLPAPARRGA